MSDDHQNQDGGSTGLGDDVLGDDDYGEEAKTELVDMDAIDFGDDEPQFAPPPTVGDDEEEVEPNDKTQLLDPDDQAQLFDSEHQQQSGGGAITSSAPDVGDTSFGAEPAPFDADDDSDDGTFSSVDPSDSGITSSAPADPSAAAAPPPSESPSSTGGQVVIGGDDDESAPDHEGATQFININDFADQDDAHFTPEQEEAGYDGSTQFVDVNALQAGAAAPAGDPIENDEDLRSDYEFSADDIRRGEVTTIQARNLDGQDVVLKQIWEGSPEEMSTPLRDRIAELSELDHPNLMSMNGMFVTDSGMWIELDAPSGSNLAEILEEHGPLTLEALLEWLEPIVDALEYVHGEQLAYANLTPETIWLDGEMVRLEPFDMLRFADRGDLGDFGAPEMEAPPEERQLSPATDVYSLAAVAAAALTGLPLRSENLEEYDDQKLIDRVCQGLSEQPDQRPATATEFLETVRNDGPDIKIVAGGVLAVAMIAIAAVAMLSGDDPSDSAAHPDQTAGAVEEEVSDDELAEIDEAHEHSEQEAQEDQPDIDLPGETTDDPRLTVHTSYTYNPPVDAATAATDEQLDQWRQQVQQLRQQGDQASSDSDRFQYYNDALELLTYILRAQNDPPEQDRQAWRDVRDERVVREEMDERIDSFQQVLLDGRISEAARRYRQIARTDPQATASSFLGAHTYADVVELQRVEDHEDDDND